MPRQVLTKPLTKSTLPSILLLTLDTLKITKDAEHSVATVTLTQPHKRNALNQQALQDIEHAYRWLSEKCFDVDIVILVGQGKSFCTGHDLKSEKPNPILQTSLSLRAKRVVQQQGGKTIRAIREADFVTIACVHGHAIGGGFGLMIGCDLRVVEQNTVLFFPEIDMGNPVPWGLTPLLAKEVGMPLAKELVLLGCEMTPQRGFDVGLINRVCDGWENTVNEAELMAYTIAAKKKLGVTLAVTQFRSLETEHSSGNVLRYEADWMLSAGTRSKL